jgi:hypothetical protein
VAALAGALLAALLVTPVQAAHTGSAPAATATQGQGVERDEPATRGLRGGPLDALDLLFNVVGLFGGGSNLDLVLAMLEALSQQVDALSKEVRDGFNQLEIDIANSRYANAQDELRSITTQVTTGMRYLRDINNPASSEAQRQAALAKLTRHCTGITVDTPELLQMYYGDPADAMSQAGLLPAAWDVLMAGERSLQKAKAGATPAFLSYRTIRQMRRVGDFSQLRIAQYGLVKGACDALLFTDPTDRQTAATEVHDLIVDGDRDTPGLKAIDKSMPAALPRRTGVFPRSTVGTRGLVVGNFNRDTTPDRSDDAAMRLQNGNVMGSPLGDNPVTPGAAWSASWVFLKSAWLDAIQTDVAATGTNLTNLSLVYGATADGVEGNLRLLPTLDPSPGAPAFNPGWWIKVGPQSGFGDNKDWGLLKKEDGLAPAGPPMPAERTFIAAVGGVKASNIFGVPVVGCAYRFERPKVGGFNCPSRR